MLGLLSATNYRWPDDLPFVRIPKAAIKQIGPQRGINAQGKLDDWAADLLALTPEERQRAEENLGELTAAMAQLAASRAYETNYMPLRLRYSDWSAHKLKAVAVPPLGSQAESLADQTLGQLCQDLGQDRAQLLIGDALARRDGTDCDPWVGACMELASTPQMFTALVNTSPSNQVDVGVFRTGQAGCTGLTAGGMGTNDVRLTGLPAALITRFFDPWLDQLSLTNTQTQTGP